MGIRTTTSASANSVPSPARWATWCAYAVPWIILPTALWRLPFAFGFDMGMIDPEAPAWVWWVVPYTIGLVVLTEVLAYLTVGLVSWWGEVFPSWIPLVGGRPVRPGWVVAAATTGGIALCALWIPDWVDQVWFGGGLAYTSPAWEALAKVGLVTHVVWGPMLLAVTFDYWRRHR
jgi:hypothetical protein